MKWREDASSFKIQNFKSPYEQRFSIEIWVPVEVSMRLEDGKKGSSIKCWEKINVQTAGSMKPSKCS